MAVSTTGRVNDEQFINQAIPTADKGLISSTQPTLDDFISEAKKLGSESVMAQQAALRQDTEQVGQDLSRQLYGQNVGNSGISDKVIGKAITEQQKRLEPIAAQAGVATAQQELQQRYEMTNKAIDLAVAGNLTGDGAQQIVSAAFGNGITLTNKDQQDLQNAATASGLTPEEFALMKRSVGTAQWDDIMANPQDYVESPAKIRAFQMQLAQMQVDAMQNAADTQASATRDAANASSWGDAAQGAAAVIAAVSDKKLKKNIKKIVNALDILKKIKPVRFNWKRDNKPDIGVIAQDLEKVLPELVHKNPIQNIKLVNYNGLFTILLKGVQELITRVELLERK